MFSAVPFLGNYQLRQDNRIDPSAVLGLFHAVGWTGVDPINIPGQIERAKLILTVWSARDLVGYLHAITTPHGCMIDTCAVSPNHRGHGIGRALLERAISQLKAAGCSRLEVEAWDGYPGLPSYYEKFGFHLTGRSTGVGRIMELGRPPDRARRLVPNTKHSTY